MDQDFYFNFEKKFRGSRENIIDRISIYDSLIQLIIKQKQDHKFLDIGCGRGEWLQKWNERGPDCIGIEVYSNMTNYCLNQGFKVIQDDAIKTLKSFESQSISVITIFHLIEHLDNNYLNQLMSSCYRVLAENGLLIIETPSIDNLLVSTKSFYLDPTHINHINPDSFSFLLEQKGFSKSNYYYINGGPLHSSTSSLKITKILNGVAQDITFIASKSNKISKLIFEEETYWQRDFSNALSTLEAAVAYDLEIQNVMDESQKKYKKVVEELNQSKSEILLLKNELKYLILLIKILKKIFKPFLSLFRYVVKKFIYILNKIFNLIIKFSIVRKTLKSENFL